MSGLPISILAFQTEKKMEQEFAEDFGSQFSSHMVSQLEFSVKETEGFIKLLKQYLDRHDRNDTFLNRMIHYVGDHLGQNINLGSVTYWEMETGYILYVHPPENYLLRSASVGFSGGNFTPPPKDYREKIVVEELIPNHEIKGEFVQNKYLLNDFPNKKISTEKVFRPDILDSQRFQDVLKTPEPNGTNWTESYQFRLGRSEGHTFGNTCFERTRDARGKSLALIGIDTSTHWLSAYLENCLSKTNKKGLNAFVFEKTQNGGLMVIAHSRKESVFPITQDGQYLFLCKQGEIKSQVVKDMMDQIPDEFTGDKDPTGSKLVKFTSQGSGFVGVIHDILPGRPPQWVVCLYISEEDLFKNVIGNFHANMVLTMVVMLGSGLVSLVLAKSASLPLERLTQIAGKIGKLDFEGILDTKTPIREVRELTKSLDQMKIGLQSFIRYLPKDLLVSLFKSGLGARPGGTEKNITICFTDVENFTKFSEQMHPNDLLKQLNEYLSCFSLAISDQEGTVDKFIGDAVMAFWNAPDDCDGHPLKACKAAIFGMKRLSMFQKEWRAKKMPVFKARVGLNTGSAIVGNIGTDQHLNYTVIGDNVNLASRLEGLNKIYGTSILITQNTLDHVADKVVTRPVDLVAVKGKGIRIKVHELIGLREESSPEIVARCEEHGRAYALYMDRAWTAALLIFEKLACDCPDDYLPRLFAQRCTELLSNPPQSDWDGSIEILTK